MCDQTEVKYLDGDVVWVKIGPVWWPGVVKDLDNEEGKEILAGLKKKPIACVKFFNEENYEFVKNLDQIYHYNCRKKDEFIKKGLDKFRTGAEHMKKFPADVTNAESLVNGDVNIINDPKFQPEEKQNYNEIFGTGKKKKKKEKEISPRFKPRPSSSTPSPYRPITHQRFINKALHGESDHKVKTLIQPTTSPDEPAKKIYKCHVCKLEASRVNVIVDHMRLAHSSTQAVHWTSSDGPLVRRKPTYKARKLKTKKLFESFDEDSNDVSVEEPKRKSPVKKQSKDKVKAETKSKSKASSSPAKSTTSSPGKRKADGDESKLVDPKKPRFTDVLLADWSEDEDDAGKNKSEDEKPKSEADAEDTKEKEAEMEVEPEVKEDGSQSDDSSKPANEEPKNEKMSCFDFDEEEEGFIGMSNANTYGRKIPRVIPVKDKSDLGVDLEIEELFKRKSESDAEDVKNDETLDDKQATDSQNETADEDEMKDDAGKSDPDVKEEKKVKGKRGRKPKAKEAPPPPPVSQDSLALRRTRRPGAKKSYLNEVIEKIEVDEDGNEKIKPEQADSDSLESPLPKAEVKKVVKEESTGSSSRRKQDLRSLGSERDEMIYSDIVKSDQKPKPAEKKSRKRSSDKKEPQVNDDLTKQIDKLLTETSVPDLPPAPEAKTENQAEESSNTLSLSFDYVPAEPSPVKIVGKVEKKSEGKSISKMFSDCLDNSQQSKAEEEGSKIQDGKSPQKEEASSAVSQSLIKKVASPPTSPRKKVILSPLSKSAESSGGQVAVFPVIKTTSATSKGGCVILSSGEKVDLEKIVAKAKQDPAKDSEPKTKTIKTIKLKPDSIPTSLLASGKLKGQTIIHQKGGKYVIVTQPPSGQQKVIPGKPTTPNKVVILTNQHGEQKIITTGGLKQSRLSQKLLASPDSAEKGESSASTSAGAKQTQPIIKMVPDGKGGVMKQVTVSSPKKVILGGTKVLVSPVSGSSSASSARETVQKIALPSGGGDFRLIENYKGSGKTVLIQSTSGPGNLILKSGSASPRQTVSRVIQAPKNILSLQKKPKIVMKTSGGQGEQYVVHSGIGTTAAASPTYVMKKKGADGKIATQRIITRPVMQAKTATPSGSKTIFLSSGQAGAPKGEPIIIKSGQEPLTNLVRLKSSQKEPESTTLKTKIIQKAPEVFATSQNNYVLATGTTEQTVDLTQTVQVQEQPQQPVLQTQVVAMPTVGPDGNQTFMLVSVDEQTGQWQTVDNSIIAYDISGQQEQVFINPAATNNVILIDNQQTELAPVFSTASQDILAEALANTNVLDGSISTEMEPVLPSMLLPPAIPSSVVQETSITLQKPIMTPLEMPSSVAPDTSGLEPPPLPPTPTEEDVLMEEPEESLNEGQLMEEKTAEESQVVEESDVITTETYTEEGTHLETVEESYQEAEYQEENKNGDYANGNEETQGNVVEYYQAGEYQEEKVQEEVPREDFIIENSQEEQGANSFQSMPLLNDEPDTSDDAQGSEPIADQDFELQKSRMGNGDFSPLLREQEPPSSTNNDIVTESNYENNERFDNYPTHQLAENNSTTQDQTFQEDEGKDKESLDNKDNQSMPVISDEGNVNSFEMDPSFVISQKRFQEETEVTSTTDEFTNKDNVV